MHACVQVKAREAGLWNLFLPAVSGLSQLDYAYIAEETGRCLFAPEVFNCQAPGKMTECVKFNISLEAMTKGYFISYMILHFFYRA